MGRRAESFRILRRRKKVVKQTEEDSRAAGKILIASEVNGKGWAPELVAAAGEFILEGFVGAQTSEPQRREARFFFR